MKFSQSLKKNMEFRKVYQCGKSAANRFLVMYVMENSLAVNRLGISVSKKVGNSVVRHRITRLIREGYRLQEERFMSGYDVIFVARAAARGFHYQDAEHSILYLADIHKIRKY